MAASGPSKVRKKKKFKSPNPLFEQWLSEWRDEAASKGSRAQYTYSKALSSLRKYPLPLSCGKEAKVLEYFGDKICAMLDEKLQQYKLQHAESDSCTKTLSPSKYRVPACRSDKEEKATQNKPKPAVSSSCVILPDAAINRPVVPECLEMCPEEEDSFSLLPGTYEIVLCVDNFEAVSGLSTSRKRFLSELEKSGIQFEVRKLSVGDFLWIARGNSNPTKELVMDFIVERKRLDDLARSIKDGRFREQKFRLKNCGVRCPVYLVEHHNSYPGLPESTLEQAIINTQVVDGFIIKRTQDSRESVAYLSYVTKFLQHNLQEETLRSGSRQAVKTSNFQSRVFLTFEEFNNAAVKNKCLTVQEMFAKHLLQFHGLSVDRAAALVTLYKTPAKLYDMLESCQSETEQVKGLAEIKFGKSQRNMGNVLGKQLHHFYTSRGPLL